MALTNTEKNLAICQLEKVIDDAKTAAGVADLGEFDTEVGALRTAYDADPATATAVNIQALRAKVEAFSFAGLTGLTSLWAEIKTEAAA